MMLRSKHWMALTLLFTLLLGVGVGILLDRTVLEEVVHSRDVSRARGERDDDDRRENRTRRWFEKLTTELELDADQQARLETVLQKNHDTAHAFWSQSRAEFEELRQSFRADIRELLTEPQRERYDAMLAEYDARRKDHDRD